MHRTIPLRPSAPPEAVLAAARATLEEQGYLWSRRDATTAEAHESGKKVRGRLFTFRLRLGLTVDDGRLELSALSTRLGLAGTTGSPAATMRIRRRLGRCARAVGAALTETGLAC